MLAGRLHRGPGVRTLVTTARVLPAIGEILTMRSPHTGAHDTSRQTSWVVVGVVRLGTATALDCHIHVTPCPAQADPVAG